MYGLRERFAVVRFVPVAAAVLLLALVLAGCGGGGQEEGNAPPGNNGNGGADEVSISKDELNDEETAGELPEKEPVKQNAAAEGRAQVGGFVVEGTGGVEPVRVPEVTVDRSAAREYLNEVRPILGESARDVSGAFTPRARVENGQLRLEVEQDPVKEARESARNGLERLRQVEVPEGLQPIQQQLVGSYERALPAYDDINDAFASGDAGRLDAAVRENLPRIEQLNDVGGSVVQDLERATNAGGTG